MATDNPCRLRTQSKADFETTVPDASEDEALEPALTDDGPEGQTPPPVVESAPSIPDAAPPSGEGGGEAGEVVVVFNRIFGSAFAKMKRTIVKRGNAMVGSFIEFVGGR